MVVQIAASLLSADFRVLGECARQCTSAGAEYLHFDIMDGVFVPNISFGGEVLRALREQEQVVFDTHLMIVQPERYVGEFAEAGADIITVHAEACTHLQRVLALIRDCGARAGLALNPATPLNVLDYVLEDVDQLLIMTVNPGCGGQSLLPATLGKVARARALLDAAGRDIPLEVDGGITQDNARLAVEAGANVLVAGTSVFGHPNGPAAGVRALREACAGARP